MKISVIVPTYRRIPSLERCLAALAAQYRMPDEVVVIVRNSDSATLQFLEGWRRRRGSALNLRVVRVDPPGQVAALNAGLDSAAGDIAAITDDDAAPRKDWLQRIEEHFRSDPALGGLGGRDWVYENGRLLSGAKMTVGKIQWFGRVIGNHHLGIGGPREADLLKGVNMAFRREAIRHVRFLACLKGTGAQMHNEIDFCLKVKKAGWKVVYDPQVAVDHYPAPRFDADKRSSFHAESFANRAHNETFALMNNFSPGRSLLYLLWAFAVGNRMYPGFLQWLRLLPQSPRLASQKWKAAVKGRIDGLKTWRRMKGGSALESGRRDADCRPGGRVGNHAASSAGGKQAVR